MAYFKEGGRVEVARDIFRAEGVIDLTKLSRIRGKYASQGEVGTVKDLFRPVPTGSGELGKWYAKVAMDGGGIKTFRLSSLNRLTDPEH
jgi:hypothetical protein